MSATEQTIDRNFILGKKGSMTRIFNEAGEAIPVTVVTAGPCQIVQIKNQTTDGYQAVQVGYGERRKLSKALLGHVRGLSPFRYIKEFRLNGSAVELKRGQMITVDTFQVGELIKVTGVSKGKGFQGVVKRHGFHGSPASHGHKDQLRMSGSIGAGGVQHVLKGTRMGGRMGGEQVSISNLEIVRIDLETNSLYIKGALPGPRGGLLKISGNGQLKLHDQLSAKQPEEATIESSTPVEQPAHETEPTESVAVESSAETVASAAEQPVPVTEKTSSEEKKPE